MIEIRKDNGLGELIEIVSKGEARAFFNPDTGLVSIHYFGHTEAERNHLVSKVFEYIGNNLMNYTYQSVRCMI